MKGNMDKLDSFVSDLLRAKNMADTPDAHRELLEKLNDRIDKAILEALPNEDLEKLNALIESNTANEDAIKVLLKNAKIDADTVVMASLEDFKNEFLNEEGQ